MLNHHGVGPSSQSWTMITNTISAVLHSGSYNNCSIMSTVLHTVLHSTDAVAAVVSWQSVTKLLTAELRHATLTVCAQASTI
jgi:hypothetical protein